VRYATHAQNVEMALRFKAHEALTDKLHAMWRERAMAASVESWGNIRKLIKETR